jgi:hypothetical protein
VLLAAFAPIALPHVGAMGEAAVGMDGEVQACGACGSGVWAEGAVENRAKEGGKDGETCGGGAEEMRRNPSSS